jgi:hypothetical protein
VESAPVPFAPPPLVAVACGAEGLAWACGSAVPTVTVAEVAAALRTEPVPVDVPPVGWAPVCADFVLAALAAGGEAAQVSAGPSFVAPVDRADRSPAPDGVELRTSEDTDLAELRPLLPERDAVLAPPGGVGVVDGESAAVCDTARSAPSSVEAGVWTYERHRRRGLATTVTSAWLALVGDRTAFYSTSSDNVASQGVARRLGLTPIGQWWQVR